MTGRLALAALLASYALGPLARVRALALAVLLASYALGPLARVSADGGPGAAIIVEVNGTPITRADLDEALLMDDDYLRAKRLGSSAAAAELKKQAEGRTLEQLVDEVLLLEAARAARLSLTPEEEREVQRLFEERVKERWGSVEALEEEMKVRRIRLERLKTRHRNGFLIRKLAYEEMGRGGFVRPEELKRYYEEHKESWQEEVTGLVSVIRVLKAGRTPEDARAQIDEAEGLLKAGQSFADVAKRYPEGPNADGGGTLEVKRLADIRAAWRPAISALALGERSGIVETGEDYFIARVERQPDSRVRTFADVQDEIYTRLEDEVRRDRLDALRERLRKTAFINPKDPLKSGADRSR